MSDNGRVDEHLKVVKGRPTDEEVAAVVAAVAIQRQRAASTRSAASSARGGSGHGWAAYWRRMRRPVRPGPHGWRRSALPD